MKTIKLYSGDSFELRDKNKTPIARIDVKSVDKESVTLDIADLLAELVKPTTIAFPYEVTYIPAVSVKSI